MPVSDLCASRAAALTSVGGQRLVRRIAPHRDTHDRSGSNASSSPSGPTPHGEAARRRAWGKAVGSAVPTRWPGRPGTSASPGMAPALRPQPSRLCLGMRPCARPGALDVSCGAIANKGVERFVDQSDGRCAGRIRLKRQENFASGHRGDIRSVVRLCRRLPADARRAGQVHHRPTPELPLPLQSGQSHVPRTISPRCDAVVRESPFVASQAPL